MTITSIFIIHNQYDEYYINVNNTVMIIKDILSIFILHNQYDEYYINVNNTVQ